MGRIYLAGGCFWGVEKYISMIKGVTETNVGYANGITENPTYKEVCTQKTGHAETVRVDYDESVISLSHLLYKFLSVIDPFSVNKQGEDEGPQYRSGIYYENDAQLPQIREVLLEIEQKHGKTPAVEVLPIQNYYPAEEYHQKYLEKNPSGYCHIKF